jgi:uncharacterized protein
MPMDFTRSAPEGRQLIQAHREGGFTIAGVRHEGSVLVLPDRTLPWAVRELAALTIESLAPITATADRVDILVLGSGSAFGRPGADVRAALRAHGIVTEAMDTRAACRTFNVLLAEDRRVAAALIAR